MTDNGKYLQYYKCITLSSLWFINMNLSNSKYQLFDLYMFRVGLFPQVRGY